MIIGAWFALAGGGAGTAGRPTDLERLPGP